MKRKGSDYQPGDRFILKRPFNKNYQKGDVVEIKRNLGKIDKKTRVEIQKIKNTINQNISTIVIKVNYLGRRLK